MERLLGFPPDAYFPQLGRSGLKPDFTPHDLVAHRYVLDAKSSTQDLGAHEAQIRRYIDQRQLDYGVLFNLREVRVYRRGEAGHESSLSLSLLALWHVARGEALTDEETIGPLSAFSRASPTGSSGWRRRSTASERRAPGPSAKSGGDRRDRPRLPRRPAARPVDRDAGRRRRPARDPRAGAQASARPRARAPEGARAVSAGPRPRA